MPRSFHLAGRNLRALQVERFAIQANALQQAVLMISIRILRRAEIVEELN
jgi:hypothetical protein